MANVTKKWTHKVVKVQRGGQGEWFSYPAAMAGSEAECREYAAAFAVEQRGVGGTRIVVRTRGNKPVAEFRC